jgi:hypothetical protein
MHCALVARGVAGSSHPIRCGFYERVGERFSGVIALLWVSPPSSLVPVAKTNLEEGQDIDSVIFLQLWMMAPFRWRGIDTEDECSLRTQGGVSVGLEATDSPLPEFEEGIDVGPFGLAWGWVFSRNSTQSHRMSAPDSTIESEDAL